MTFQMPIKPYRYAVLEAVAREMRANKEMCYFYEYQSPIASLPTGEILNLWKEFGDLRTSANGWPLDEAWYLGAAIGLGSAGVRVLVELPSMTAVYAYEQIFNQIGNMRMMTGGQANMPVVIWQDGAARAGGSAQQHTQVGWEAMYANIPGLKIVAPRDAYQAAGLMAASLKDPDPVLFCDYSEVASGTQPMCRMPPTPLRLVKPKSCKKARTLRSWAGRPPRWISPKRYPISPKPG